MTQVGIADLLASSPVDPTAHLDPDRVRRYAELLDDLPRWLSSAPSRDCFLLTATIESPPPRLAGSSSSRP
jgi:hypothetical protein